MKITRRRLRQLIETTIKPSIPNMPSDDMVGKIDTLARSSDMRADADSFAGAFGYPEDRSYSQDLANYDIGGRVTIDMPKVPLPNGEEKVIPVAIPYNLVDDLIDKYQIVYDLDQKGAPVIKDAWKLRDAAMRIYKHMEDELINKHGLPKYIEFTEFGYGGVTGYRFNEYEVAMEYAGYYI